jgi:hypothetical protein
MPPVADVAPFSYGFRKQINRAAYIRQSYPKEVHENRITLKSGPLVPAGLQKV